MEDDVDRVNKEIAHLTSARFVEPARKQWDVWGLYSRVRPVMAAFAQQVPRSYLHESWNPSVFLLEAPPSDKNAVASVVNACESPATGATETALNPDHVEILTYEENGSASD